MLIDKLIGAIAPHSCLNCGQEGQLVCEECLPQIVKSKRSSCFLCNRLTADWRVCSSCRHKSNLRGVLVASHYEDYIKQLVRLLKYHHTVSAAKILAKLLVPLIQAQQFDLVTAVPPSSQRYRQRGYNQAQLIAKATARQLRLPYYDLLRRVGQSRQVGTDRRQRLQQMQHKMYAVRPYLISGKRLLVIDDVVTTGASINEAGRALKQAGAKYVWGAAAAKH